MPVNILYAATPGKWETYQPTLTKALQATGLDFDLRNEFDPEAVDYIVYASNSPLQDFTPYKNLKAVLNLWAGVEGIVGNKSLTVPLARMVDKGMTSGMVEWVTGHTLRHHLGMDRHILAKPGEWHPVAPPLARHRRVTVLGLGALGSACATTLASLGFDVAGWSRSAKSIPGVTCHHGPEGLRAALEHGEITILLMPNTPETENTLNAETIAMLPRGAIILNPGRGPLIDDAALLSALDTGQVGHATLDVFRVEPLPADHAYWTHPKVTVTPHIASETRPDTASEVIAENIRRGEAGEPFLHLVDRTRGY